MYGSQRRIQRSQTAILAERGLVFGCCYWLDANKLNVLMWGV